MPKNITDSPLYHRDVEAERSFLLGISSLNYTLLQRDWLSGSHGDLDLVIPSEEWPRLVDAVIAYSEANDIPIVKVYEIEHAVVCVTFLLENSYIHLDICIVPCRRRIFGVRLSSCLQSRELVDGIYVADKKHADIYKKVKRLYKKFPLAMTLRKIRNSAVIARRLFKTTLFVRGAMVYIPYVHDGSLLRSKAVVDTARRYLLEELLPKYSNHE